MTIKKDRDDPIISFHGVGRVLLDSVHALSSSDPNSSGVALSTETRQNLEYYDRFGYRALSEAQADELVTWTLYRPDA